MTAVPATGARPAARLPGAIPVGIARGRLELMQFFREKDAVVFTFAFPVILLVIFGAVFGNQDTGGVKFSQYFAAGMIASGLMNTGFQSLAIGIPVDRDDGTLTRLAGTPMPASSYFLGKILLVLTTSAAQIVILLTIAALFFGLNLPTDVGRWLTFLWVCVLSITACTLLGIAFSSIPRSGKSAPAVVTPLVIVLQFISGVFFVYSQRPTWMQQVAALFPLKWMTQGMRSVFLPDQYASTEPAGSWEHGRVALVLAVWVVLGLGFALKTFRWRRRDAG